MLAEAMAASDPLARSLSVTPAASPMARPGSAVGTTGISLRQLTLVCGYRPAMPSMPVSAPKSPKEPGDAQAHQR
jgi:hypothetical protein